MLYLAVLSETTRAVTAPVFDRFAENVFPQIIRVHSLARGWRIFIRIAPRQFIVARTPYAGKSDCNVWIHLWYDSCVCLHQHQRQQYGKRTRDFRVAAHLCRCVNVDVVPNLPPIVSFLHRIMWNRARTHTPDPSLLTEIHRFFFSSCSSPPPSSIHFSSNKDLHTDRNAFLLLCSNHWVGRWYSGRVSQTFQNRIDAVVKSYGDTDTLRVSKRSRETNHFGVAWNVNEYIFGLRSCVRSCVCLVIAIVYYVSIYSQQKHVLCEIRRNISIGISDTRECFFYKCSFACLRIHITIFCTLAICDRTPCMYTSLSLIWNMVGAFKHFYSFTRSVCHSASPSFGQSPKIKTMARIVAVS